MVEHWSKRIEWGNVVPQIAGVIIAAAVMVGVAKANFQSSTVTIEKHTLQLEENAKEHVLFQISFARTEESQQEIIRRLEKIDRKLDR